MENIEIAEEFLKTRIWFDTGSGRIELEMALPGHSGWRLGLLFLLHEESLVIAEVKIFPDGDRRALSNPTRGIGQQALLEVQPRRWSEDPKALVDVKQPSITTQMLRSIHPSEFLSVIREWIEKNPTAVYKSELAEVFGIGEPKTIGEAFKSVTQTSPVRDRETLLEKMRWAARYLELIEEKCPRPRAQLAEEIGRKPEAVRDALKFLREKGYLSSSNGPLAGGKFTEAGRQFFQSITKESTDE